MNINVFHMSSIPQTIRHIQPKMLQEYVKNK